MAEQLLLDWVKHTDCFYSATVNLAPFVDFVVEIKDISMTKWCEEQWFLHATVVKYVGTEKETLFCSLDERSSETLNNIDQAKSAAQNMFNSLDSYMDFCLDALNRKIAKIKKESAAVSEAKALFLSTKTQGVSQHNLER